MDSLVIWFRAFPKDDLRLEDRYDSEDIELFIMVLDPANGNIKKSLSGNMNQLMDLIKEEAFADTHIILPAEDVILTAVMIPSKTRQKILQALPFMLEDTLFEDIDQQFFALGEMKDEKLNIAIVKRSIMDLLKSKFRYRSLSISWVTSEIFQLPYSHNEWTLGFIDDKILVRYGEQSGIVFDQQNAAFSLAVLFNEQGERLPAKVNIVGKQNDQKITDLITRIFSEQQIDVVIDPISFTELLVKNTIARQGSQKETINLLQSEYHAESFVKQKLPFLKTLIVLSIIWLCSQSFFMLYQWQKLQSEAEQTQTEVEQLFFAAFPEKKRLVDLRSQTENEIKQLRQNKKQQDSFMLLLSAVAETLQQFPDVQIQQLKYVEGLLQLDITSNRFIYKELESQLSSQYNLNVNVQSSSKSGNTINSVLVIKKNSGVND